MIPRNNDNPVTFFLWWHRLQMAKFHPVRNWLGCPMISHNNANFMIGALAICICESIGQGCVAMSHRIAALLICHMKPDPDMKPLCIGTDLGFTQEHPRTYWNIRPDLSILCIKR